MPGRAIIYGQPIGPQDRKRLKDRASGNGHLIWMVGQELFEPSGEDSLVVVDLDAPELADPQFLLSLATAGKTVKVVGKSDNFDNNEAIRVSKLGVSEILTGEQCLKRLSDFLDRLATGSNSLGKSVTRFDTQALIGRSPAIDEIRGTIKLLSDVDFPSALILGETGTGKSLISKILHNAGVRSDHNLVEVNCSAIPDELFESELFGHVKGAFTDAKGDKAGLFEYSQGGTLFLDEVGNLSSPAQGKLLKILEDKKLRKVGSVDETDIDVRVVAATNLDLKSAIKAKTFREDLYFRLNLMTIFIPPLRERAEDIPEILEYYLGYYCNNYGKPGLTIDPLTVNRLCQYAWPGNIRELCNVVERAVLLNQTGTITEKDISIALRTARIDISERRQIIIDVPPQGITLQKVEESVVKHVLNMCSWNKSEAARFLNISRPRLRRIIEGAGLEQNKRRD